jgi:small subunit ribosomal protein S24e
VSKDELRSKLAELYKANKDQVNVFGLRTQYGGGKTTGFALIYDSHEAMKKFEPRHRLVRIGATTKVEKASKQQRMCTLVFLRRWEVWRVVSGFYVESI